MSYDLAMLALVAVGIIPGAIVATFVVAGAPLSPGTQAATTIRQNNDAAQRTADAVEQNLEQQTEVTTALQGVMVDQQN
ncbi:hypothetical protein VC83_03137 [Pseudogymnoascus destructans]|uniref:Uncharacterized protein n=1 Tax=Pseudogymnoascus destructans TaxID=655981 RepID=A0A177AFU2_9PEZI|nr:uncharacterized protein VC83_03137 [Pseudogymnoascus destructans]OAF60282.1 hypothetical protein VC83_03137 [Pseudogymnoascus destructans]